MEWKPEYAIIFFFVFVGAGLQFTQDKNIENMPVVKRVYSQFAAVLFVGLLLIGIFSIWLNWSPWFPVILGIPTGIQGEKFLRLWMAYGSEANGLLDFIDRMQKAYKMVKNSTQHDENETKP